MTTFKPELLMPAGSMEKLKLAFMYGADAVYAGVPLFSLRARENEISFEDLKEAMSLAKTRHKKVYLTANIFARNLKLKSFREHMGRWAELKPDALIMSDPGLIDFVKQHHPEIPIHLSVQANCMNWMAVRFWKKIGVDRIILSRELRLTEIQEIKHQVPEMELEAFVHGSICIAYSGRCLMSHYMSYRDANQGVCDNSCRYPYKVFAKNADQPIDELYLQDLRNPSEFYPMEEDEHGTYIMNSKDLCLIEHLKAMRDAGVCSFKVEGRTKSAFYAAMLSRIYRQAIDDMAENKPLDRDLLRQLDLLGHRGYHKGFLMGEPSHQAQNYQESNRGLMSTCCGLVVGKKENLSAFEVKGRLQVGDWIEVYSPDGFVKVHVRKLYASDGAEKSVLHPGSGIGYVDAGQILTEHSFLCRVT